MQPNYVDALEPEAVATAARQAHALWGGDRTVEQHVADTFEQLERGHDLLRFVGLRDRSGALVCSLKRYDAVLSTPSGAVRTVGIGALFTTPEQRRRGHANRLVRIVMEQARSAGYGAALLYSDIDPRFYERMGYVLLPHPTWIAKTPDLPPMDAFAVRPIDDAGQLLAIHERSFEPNWVRMRRNGASWALATWRQRQAKTWLLIEQEREVGYIIASKHDDLLWVVDEAMLEPQKSAERLWATLRKLAVQEGAARIAGWLRPDHAGGPFAASPRSCCIPMVAPLDARLAHIGTLATHLSSFDHF